MPTYAIGDLQACLGELHDLLVAIAFDPTRDQLWFTGDLVNRGPHSLDTLRFIKGLGDAAISVLGNHDLHLLAVAAGASRVKRHDTFAAVLDAPDRTELLDWLRTRPLLHSDSEFYLIHAGLPPQWDLSEAGERAREVEAVLRSAKHQEFYPRMYGDHPNQWNPALDGWERLRFITNCFTRMRYCDHDGRLDLKEKSAPGHQPAHLLPWFTVPGRRSAGHAILFGHWSTLGYHEEQQCHALDSGCLWGGPLTALRLDTREVISVPCRVQRYCDLLD